jgi:hypothetical protein
VCFWIHSSIYYLDLKMLLSTARPFQASSNYRALVRKNQFKIQINSYCIGISEFLKREDQKDHHQAVRFLIYLNAHTRHHDDEDKKNFAAGGHLKSDRDQFILHNYPNTVRTTDVLFPSQTTQPHDTAKYKIAADRLAARTLCAQLGQFFICHYKFQQYIRSTTAKPFIF